MICFQNWNNDWWRLYNIHVSADQYFFLEIACGGYRGIYCAFWSSPPPPPPFISIQIRPKVGGTKAEGPPSKNVAFITHKFCNFLLFFPFHFFPVSSVLIYIPSGIIYTPGVRRQCNETCYIYLFSKVLWFIISTLCS